MIKKICLEGNFLQHSKIIFTAYSRVGIRAQGQPQCSSAGAQRVRGIAQGPLNSLRSGQSPRALIAEPPPPPKKCFLSKPGVKSSHSWSNALSIAPLYQLLNMLCPKSFIMVENLNK